MRSAAGPLRRAAGLKAAELPAPRVRGVGLLTGWDEAPAAPRSAPGGPPPLLPVATPALAGERFRRATRECLLGVAAARAAVTDAGLAGDALAGARTGVLYVSGSAYAAANRAFLEDERAATLHFPYTAPSAVPGEVTIEFGVRGPYVSLMGGGPAALQGLWYAAQWLAAGAADRVLVLAVETVQEVRDLFGRARRLYRPPLVEGAACLVLEPGDGTPLTWASAVTSRPRTEAVVRRVLDAVLQGRAPRIVARASGAHAAGRAEHAVLLRRGAAGAPVVGGGPGEAMACGPLVGLAAARARGEGGPCLVTAAWRNDYGAMCWPL